MNISSSVTKTSIPIGEYANFIAYIVEGIVLAVLVVYYFIPSYREIRNLQEDVDLKKRTLAEVTGYADYLKQLADTTIDVEESIVDYALPSENDVITLILTYEGLAAANEDVAVSPLSLEPGVLEREDDPEEKLSGLQQIEFGMEVTASDDEAARTFIDQITKTRRIFDISSLSWQEPDADAADENNELTLSLSLTTYYYIGANTAQSRALVRQGQAQQEFITQLRNGTVFEDLILEGIELGKDDLFAKESTQSART